MSVQGSVPGRNRPRWADLAWYLGALVTISAFLATAYRRGYDLTETLGYLWMNLFSIFLLLIGLGLIISVAVKLANLASGRARLKKPEARIIRFVASLCLLLIGTAAAEAFMFWHPLGMAWSIVVATMFFVAIAVLAIRLGRSSGLTEEEMIALHDKALKARDDPNEPARFVP